VDELQGNPAREPGGQPAPPGADDHDLIPASARTRTRGRTERPRKPGYRIGPFYFVPEFGAVSRDDPWAHRKGEPRVFALFWSVYLMGSAMLTLFAIGSASIPTAAQYQIGSASMITMIAVGSTLLWPLVRLSQASPEHPVGATLADMFVLLAPMQIVIWPLPLLTHWPLEIVAGLSGLLAAWTLLIGVIVARGTASTDGVSRVLAMLACITLVATGPLLLSIVPQRAPAHEQPGPWMLSPLTGIWALVASPSGLRPRLSQTERLGVAAPALLAGVLALGLHVVARRPPGR